MDGGRLLRWLKTWRGAGALPTQAGGAWAAGKLKGKQQAREDAQDPNKGKQTSNYLKKKKLGRKILYT